ncbi:MAG: type II toxin -antitoxin system TacA 1-like antitoxin [Acidimicrobiales bacterium]
MVKTERLEARVAASDVQRIRRAAEAQRVSVAAFVVAAARARADQVLAQDTETVVPAEYFDRLLRELDAPAEIVPELATAIERGSGHPVINR